MVVPPQLKGIKQFHGAQRQTWTRGNVQLECGWVASSSNRREWIFVQNDTGDARMSTEGKQQYQRLNNLGAHRMPFNPAALPFWNNTAGTRFHA